MLKQSYEFFNLWKQKFFFKSNNKISNNNFGIEKQLILVLLQYYSATSTMNWRFEKWLMKNFFRSFNFVFNYSLISIYSFIA